VPRVRAPHVRRCSPGLDAVEVCDDTVAGVMPDLDVLHPGLGAAPWPSAIRGRPGSCRPTPTPGASPSAAGCASWPAPRQGLPQEQRWDVVSRHAGDVGVDVLAFGSTTGNVGRSDDRGGSWRAPGRHLPPVDPARCA
jgi:hypothetical protein